MKKVLVVLSGTTLLITAAVVVLAARGRNQSHVERGGSRPDAHEERGNKEAERVQADNAVEQIEKKICEHKIRQLDCDECRYELGAVKVQPSVTDALIRTAAAQQREVSGRLRLTGEVRPDDTAVVDVLPAAPGKIVAVKAWLGQKVNAGDVLAVLHSGDYGEVKAAYLEAATAMDIAVKEKDRQSAVSAALEKLLAAAAQAQPDYGGGMPLGEWKSKLVGASARLQHAKMVHEREKLLLAKQASTKAELETAERELHTAQADYSALAEEVQLNLHLDRLKAENAARLAEAKWNAAEQRLHLFGLDDQAIKSITHSKENGSFAQLEIKAPRAGIITAQSAAQGKFVETSQTLFTVADLSNLWVWCDLYERDFGVLHEYMASTGMPKAAVRVSAFPTAFPGTLDHVGSMVDETTRTLKVRVQVQNSQSQLKPGMFATVEVELPTGRQATFVPKSAVLSDEGRQFVFQHWKEDLWLKRDVVPGAALDDMIAVTGLEPGAKVVSSGAFLLKSDILRAKMGAGCAD